MDSIFSNKYHLNVTSPIFYVNADPHMGHAYTIIACDVYARYWRENGLKVLMCTGTDEHGQKVQKSAESKNINPKDYVDEISQKFKELCCLIHADDYVFIRTTEPRHIKAAISLWNKLYDKGHIYKGEYSGWYSERDETFFDEKELVDGNAPTGAPVQFIKEDCYFLRLSAFQDRLLHFLESNSNFVKPSTRYNEVVSFVKSGLRDLAISRSRISWGIPVPNDNNHVMYVWIDALCNYITCLNYPDLSSIDLMQKTDHVVGKDILIFHAVYWPIILMGADLPLPRRIIAHGWWKINEQKMSKSLRNVVTANDLIDKYGIDQTRFYLLRDVPFGEDGSFSFESIANRINADLVNNFGNLIHRTVSFCKSNKIELICKDEKWNFLNSDLDLMHFCQDSMNNYINNYEFHKYLDYVMTKSKQANQFIDKMKPWERIKSENAYEVMKIIWILLSVITSIQRSLLPFMPLKLNELKKQIIQNDDNSFSIGESFILFSRIDCK